MQTRKPGIGNLVVSAIGLGCMDMKLVLRATQRQAGNDRPPPLPPLIAAIPLSPPASTAFKAVLVLVTEQSQHSSLCSLRNAGGVRPRLPSRP